MERLEPSSAGLKPQQSHCPCQTHLSVQQPQPKSTTLAPICSRRGSSPAMSSCRAQVRAGEQCEHGPGGKQQTCKQRTMEQSKGGWHDQGWLRHAQPRITMHCAKAVAAHLCWRLRE